MDRIVVSTFEQLNPMKSTYISKQTILVASVIMIKTVGPAKTTLFSNHFYGNNKNCPSTYDSCQPSVCKGIDLAFARVDAPQISEDFPGNYSGNSSGNSQNINTVGPGSSFVFWDPSNKDDTLQCYKSKGRSISTFDIEDKVSQTIRGHAFFFYFETDKVTVDGSNAKVQITTPGFYLSQGGTAITNSDPGFTDVTYTKLEGTWLDICAEKCLLVVVGRVVQVVAVKRGKREIV